MKKNFIAHIQNMKTIKVMKTIQEYLETNPYATLAEYQEYCDNYVNEKQDVEVNTQKLYDDWIAEQDGKYFLVEFNDASRVLFKYSHKSSCVTSNDYYSLSFYNGYNETFIKKEKRCMNKTWLDKLNPYWPKYKELFNPFRNNDNMKVVEVPEEEADKLFARFNDDVFGFINDIKEII